MTDLQTSVVLRKTEAGIAGIKLRDPLLTPKLRMLLIVVDGNKSVAELVRAFPSADDARQMLGQLFDLGFVGITEPPKPPPRPAALPAVSSKPKADEPDATLIAATRRAAHLLEDMLGPDAEPLCLKLERCTSKTDLNVKIAEISRIVAAMRSERRAAEFLLAATSA